MIMYRTCMPTRIILKVIQRWFETSEHTVCCSLLQCSLTLRTHVNTQIHLIRLLNYIWLTSLSRSVSQMKKVLIKTLWLKAMTCKRAHTHTCWGFWNWSHWRKFAPGDANGANNNARFTPFNSNTNALCVWCEHGISPLKGKGNSPQYKGRSLSFEGRLGGQ